MQKRRFLGIDPGYATLGYAVIESLGEDLSILDFGVITTPAGEDFMQRLLDISGDLQLLFEKFSPDFAAVEEVYFSSNTKTALAVAHARGVVLCELAKHKVETMSISPNQVKSLLTGDGKADKRQVQDMVQRQFDLKSLPQPDDAADALAIAYGCFVLQNSPYR